MSTRFDDLYNEVPELLKNSSKGGEIGFFAQEVLRFCSVAGTMRRSYDLSENAAIDARYHTHVLARSIIENFFRILYIFNDKQKRRSRYDELINSFKNEYRKLLNEKEIKSIVNALEPADQSWSTLPKALDVKSMLAQLKNDFGDRLDYLYIIYRISSFDTHGKNLENVTSEVFGKKVNFPFLKLDNGIEIMANEYLDIFHTLKSAGEI